MQPRSSALYAISQAWGVYSGKYASWETIPEMRRGIKKALGRPVPKFQGKQLEVLDSTLSWIKDGCPPEPKKIDGRSLKAKVNLTALKAALEADKNLCDQGFVSDRGRQARVARRLGVSRQAVSLAIKKLNRGRG